MTLKSIQDGLAHQLKQIDSFTDKQVSIEDFTILSGGVDHAAVLEYREFDADRETYAPKTLFKWRIRVNLFVRYTDEVQGANDMANRRDEIITRLLANSTLANEEDTATAFDSLPVAGQVSDDEKVEIGGVRFLHEWITIEVEELVAG